MFLFMLRGRNIKPFNTVFTVRVYTSCLVQHGQEPPEHGGEGQDCLHELRTWLWIVFLFTNLRRGPPPRGKYFAMIRKDNAFTVLHRYIFL